MLVRQYEEAKVKSFKEYFVVVHEMPPYESSYWEIKVFWLKVDVPAQTIVRVVQPKSAIEVSVFQFLSIRVTRI